MAKAVAQGDLVVITELMVQSSRGQVEAVVVGKQSAIAFKLTIDEVVPCHLSRVETRNGTYCECAGHKPGTGCRRQVGSRVGKAGHNRVAWQIRQSVDDCKLIVSAKLAVVGPEDICIRQQGNRVLRVPEKTFERAVQEGLVLLYGQADGATELFTGQAVLDVGAFHIRGGGIKRLPRCKCLADGKRIRCV